MTQDSNAGERNEPHNDSEREPTPQEIQAAKELQEIADGHRYMPQDMRDAKEAAGKKPERPKKAPKKDDKIATGERIAKVLARAGLASRREIERLIGLGKIAVNGRILETPAVLVKATDVITVDGQVVGKAEPTRLWRYHKPVGLVTTERDPSGRPTVFDKLPTDLPRVLKVGRLDLNSEGLLLLTNDGELARALELPSAGWVRRYRARALGHTTQARLDALKDGTTVDGVIYGPMEATLDKVAEKADGRANCWVTVSITEGKNREVRKVLESIGLKVNRLIRLAYGPFQLGNLEPGEVEEVGPRVIREMLADIVPLRNLPPEGASQTRSRPAARDAAAPAGRRGGGDRFEKKGFGDKKFGDKPKEWKPRTEFEKRDYRDRDFDERPRFEGDGESRDRRPSREFTPRREFGDNKPFGEKKWTPRPERAERGDRPAFKKPYAAREEGERKAYDRPKRDFGDRSRNEGSQGDRSFRKPYVKRDQDGIPAGEAGAYERAKREFGGQGREKKWTPRPERPERGDRPAFKKPYAARDGESRGPKRDYTSREGGERKAYGDRPSAGGFKGAPRGGKPGGPRPGGRPNAARPGFKPRRDS